MGNKHWYFSRLQEWVKSLAHRQTFREGGWEARTQRGGPRDPRRGLRLREEDWNSEGVTSSLDGRIEDSGED